ncbi:serine hydrolase domain-containing protein [Persicitalea sp.]|uniref:serine hydrolase domain-containing protein n=1 Tax=Persicitalea sp. TaxID=3100273 RepID=UPI003594607D
MKTKNQLLTGLTLAATLLLTASSCNKMNEVEPELHAATHSAREAGFGDIGVPVFDGAKFSNSIETYMNGKAAGYGYTVFHDGKYVSGGGGGWSRKSFESNPTKHSDQQRQDIASSSKFVTALATVALLEKYNISLTTPVYYYLPVTWKPSTEFKKITFERLLAHQTGLINYKTGWPGWKKTVEELNVDSNVRAYNNVHYSLMAVILAYIDVKKNNVFTTQQLASLESKNNNWYDDGSIGMRFRSLVRLNVFKAAGLQYWNVIDYTSWNNNGIISPSQGTMGYPSVYGNEPGVAKTDLRINGGSGGLYISTSEFGRIQDAAAHGKIVSDTNYEIMKTKRLGFDGVVSGARGKYYFKNGGANNNETMIFDMGRTQICVFANSPQSDISSDATIIANAYDKAWVAPSK